MNQVLRCSVVAIVTAFLAVPTGCGRRTAPRIPDSPRPALIGTISITTRGNTAYLSWKLPDRNVEGKPMAPADIDRFRIYRAEFGPEHKTARYRLYTEITMQHPAPAVVRDNTVIWTDGNLKYGQTYGYQLRSISTRGGVSAWSPEFRIKPSLPPAIPTGLTAKGLDSAVQVKWRPVTEMLDGTAATGFIGYNIYRGTESGRYAPSPLNKQALTASSFKDDSAVNGQTYYYMVRSVDEPAGPGSESPDSEPVSAAPRDMTPPERPRGLSAVPGVKRVFLSWNDNREPDLAGYLVYRALKSGGEYERLTEKLLTRTTYLDEKVASGTTYYYTVTAVDTAGNESPRSREQSVHIEHLLTPHGSRK